MGCLAASRKANFAAATLKGALAAIASAMATHCVSLIEADRKMSASWSKPGRTAGSTIPKK